MSIPITLEDVHASESFLDGLDSKARNPTGKFYKDQHAFALMDALSAGGSYARVALKDGASDEQKNDFTRFISRLEAGEAVCDL